MPGRPPLSSDSSNRSDCGAPLFHSFVPVALGVSHHRAPVAVRERLALHQAAAIDDNEAAPPSGASLPPDSVLLATCNRFEAYTVARTADEGLARLQAALGAWWGGPSDGLTSYLDLYVGEGAVRHLFEVAAGLDSLVLGEAEIVGQVGAAARAADANGPEGRVTARLFRHAVRVGRRVRAETGIGRHTSSVSSVAIRLARQTLGDLHDRRVLVIGAGEAAVLSVRALVGAGARQVIVANRTPERAAALAVEFGGQVAPWDALPSALSEADVVVTATSAPGYLLDAQHFRAALRSRGPATEILVLDIAVPRDVSPDAASVPGVHLFNVDDLQAVRDAGLEQRRREVRKVQGVIAEEMARFEAWWREVQATATLRALHQQAEDLRAREMAKALRKLPDLSPEQRATVEALSRSLVTKLLHHPSASLKNGLGDPEHLAVTRRLFHLPSGQEDQTERTGTTGDA